jgi:hypothetical protein
VITITDTIITTFITIATFTISPECAAHIRPQSVGSEQ